MPWSAPPRPAFHTLRWWPTRSRCRSSTCRLKRSVAEASTGGRVVVVEDNVTTGKSVLECVKVLRDSGLVVEWCTAIFTYDQPESRAAFARNGLRFEALSDLPTVLDVALARRSIDLHD